MSESTRPQDPERIERLRAMTPSQRLQLALALSAQARAAVMTEVQERMPHATKDELAVAFLRRMYGDEIADKFAARKGVKVSD